MLPVSSVFETKLNSDTIRTIRKKVDLYDTNFAVPTKGIKFKVYEWDGTGTPSFSSGDQYFPLNTSEYGTLANLSLSWGTGTPFNIGLDNFAVEFSGYFYTDSDESSGASGLNFYMAGQGVSANLSIGGSTIISTTELDTKVDGAYASGSTSVGSGWRSFQIRMWGSIGYEHGGFTVLYEYTGISGQTYGADYSLRKLIPLNAGVCSTESAFLSATSLAGVKSVEGKDVLNGIKTYEFTVPYGENGYLKNSDGHYYHVDYSSTMILREGRMLKIYFGYDVGSSPSDTIGDVDGTVEYIPRATVFIDGFNLNLNTRELTVKCKDVLSLADYQFCLNYPDATSYWAAGYISNTSSTESRPDAEDFPVAFDRWSVAKAMREMLIRADIPASLLFKKEYRKNTSGSVVQTSDLIVDHNYRLDEALRYGTDEVEKYVNTFDAGTRLYEGIMKIVDTYGYVLSSRYDGAIRIQQTNNATSKESGTGSVNYKAQAGEYEEITSSTSYTFTGTGVSLIVVRNTSSGVNDNDDVYWEGTKNTDITVKRGATEVASVSYNLYYHEERFYSDGFDHEVGHNPCHIYVAQGLPYDTYTVTIDPDGTLGIDEVWTYNYDYETIQRVYNTYNDGTSIGTIGDLSFERGLDYQRNDVLVVGNRIGIYVPTGDIEGATDPESFENPVYDNIHSRNSDLSSIYNPSAANYIGRRVMTYIQEGNINTYERATWLTNYILGSYRRAFNRPDFMVYGDPQIEIMDCVSVKDKSEEDGYNKYWVQGIDESVKDDKWAIRLALKGTPPMPSYEVNSDVDISNFNNEFLINTEITDSSGLDRSGTGARSDVVSSDGYTVTVEDGSNFSTSGICVQAEKSTPFYRVCEFTRSGNDITLSSTSIHSTGLHSYGGGDSEIIEGYNLYEGEDFNNPIKIRFKCLVSGEVRVGIKKVGYPRFLAGLSSGGGLESGTTFPTPKWQKVSPGDDLIFYWGGVNQYGFGYNDQEDEDDRRVGFLADDGEYYVVIDYARNDANRTMKTYASNYKVSGISGAAADTKVINCIRSCVDNYTLSLDTSKWPRDLSVEYSPGNSGGKTSSETISLIGGPQLYNVNYVYVADDTPTGGESGDLPLKIEPLYLQVNRKYFIKAIPSIFKFKSKVSDVDGSPYSDKWDTTIYEFKENYVNGKSEPILMKENDPYEFSFNPYATNWGMGFEVEQDFQDRLDKAKSSKVYGMGYWLLVKFEVYDVSGRPSKLRTSNNQPINPGLDDYIYSTPSQSETGEDSDYGYIEMYWVPHQIDNDYTSYFHDPPGNWNQDRSFGWYEKHLGSKPSFEPSDYNIPLKLSYNYIWW